MCWVVFVVVLLFCCFVFDDVRNAIIFMYGKWFAGSVLFCHVFKNRTKSYNVQLPIRKSIDLVSVNGNKFNVLMSMTSITHNK